MICNTFYFSMPCLSRDSGKISLSLVATTVHDNATCGYKIYGVPELASGNKVMLKCGQPNDNRKMKK